MCGVLELESRTCLGVKLCKTHIMGVFNASEEASKYITSQDLGSQVHLINAGYSAMRNDRNVPNVMTA